MTRSPVLIEVLVSCTYAFISTLSILVTRSRWISRLVIQDDSPLYIPSSFSLLDVPVPKPQLHLWLSND